MSVRHICTLCALSPSCRNIQFWRDISCSTYRANTHEDGRISHKSLPVLLTEVENLKLILHSTNVHQGDVATRP